MSPPGTLESGRRTNVCVAEGLPVMIEESLFLASADGRRRSEQLSVSFDAVATPHVSWRFTRLGAAGRRAAQETLGAEPGLLV